MAMDPTASRQDSAVSPEGEPEAVVYWRAFQRRPRLIALAVLLGTAAGASWALHRPALYEADALIEVKRLNEGFLDVGEVNPVGADPALRSEIETAVRVLRGGTMKSEAAAALRAEGGHGDEAVDDASAELSARPVGSSRLVELRTRSRSPETAAGFLNALAAGYLESRRAERSTTAIQTAGWLEERLEQHRDRLEESERRLQEYAGASGLPMLSSANLNDAERRLAELESELQAVRSDLLRLQAAADAGSDAAAVDSDLLRERLARLGELRRHKAELEALYTEEHYQVRQAAAQIAEVSAAVEQEQSRLRARAERELEAARRREELLASAVAEQREQAAEAAAMAVRYQTLERETAANRDLFETFLERARQAGVAAGVPSEQARLAEPAAVPREPATPGLIPSAGVGLFSGLFAGLLGALFLERLDRTFRAPGEIAARLGIPELGFLTKMSRRRDRSLTAAGAPETRDRFEAQRASGKSRGSLTAECLRALRTSIDTAGERPRAFRSVAVTSPGSGDGKTTLAVGLAISLTEVRDRVLLIDADLRRPRVHDVLGLRNEMGLADLLGDDPADWRQAIREVPDRPGLHVLTSGVAAFGGPGLLHSEKLPRLLQAMVAEFGAVVLDTPPVLAVSDARVVAAAAECAVLTVRAERTDPAEAAEAARLLNETGARLAGAVLNAWQPSRGRYGAYATTDAYFRRPAARSRRAAA